MKDKIDLIKVDVTIQKKQARHVPSNIQADTLFTFMTELDYLFQIIKLKMVSPRYCVEDIKYLKIKQLPKVAFPMKCFCDINLHRLKDHLYWYGYYGIAFSKEWGMKKGIQPIQYINEESELRSDFTTALSTALRMPKKQGKDISTLKNYLLYQLMYLKPYSGKFQNRHHIGKRSKKQIKCFADECEWRFVPDVSKAGYRQIYHNFANIKSFSFAEVNNAMQGNESISLTFEYSDIKYLIVETRIAFQELIEKIGSLSLDENIEKDLISKIIIWEESEGDF